MSLTKLSQQAINQALAGDWQSAVELNLEILKQHPHDIEALSRLAKAYTELGEQKLALKTYKKVLRLDRFNLIAKKNLVRFKNKKTKKNSKIKQSIDPDIFLEEPGKTKEVLLLKPGSDKVISGLNIGNQVKLRLGKQSISVYDQNKQYLGKIPEEISLRLIKLIKKGNQYQSVVKAIEDKKLSIFIKEVKQSKKNVNISSFPHSKKEDYSSSIPDGIIKRPPIEEIENQEEE